MSVRPTTLASAQLHRKHVFPLRAANGETWAERHARLQRSPRRVLRQPAPEPLPTEPVWQSAVAILLLPAFAIGMFALFVVIGGGW